MTERNSRNEARGFTIVELLIVIVVIAILAAISIVAYTGIQNRAHDSAIKSDLSNLGKLSQLFQVETGSYPVAVSTLTQKEHSFRIGVPNAYATAPTTNTNLTACLTGTGEAIAFIALSTSGKVFYAYSGDGFTVREAEPEKWHGDDPTAAQRCQEIDEQLSTLSEAGQYRNFNGYKADDATTGPWRAWTGVGS